MLSLLTKRNCMITIMVINSNDGTTLETPMGIKRGAYTVLVGRFVGQWLIGRPKQR